MTSVAAPSPARAIASTNGDALTVEIGGAWRITKPHPDWNEVVAPSTRVRRIFLVGRELEAWDSSLALFLRGARRWCEASNTELQLENLPEGASRLAATLSAKREPPAPPTGTPNLATAVGIATVKLWSEVKDLSRLVGECAFSVGRFFRAQAHFRWRDCLNEAQQCGVMALPIVGLISYLVGLTLAYTGAIVVRQYGGDIWIADMVGLAVVREMGPMMAAIVLAGRTGAAYAATIGNMQANEEVDALSTTGVSPIDFLVMPRLVALCCMMPFLALYSDCMGLLGGMTIAAIPPLNIPPNLYFAETQTIVDLSDINTGLIKATTYGILIGLSGCLRGIQAERSAAGVGMAATRAVVTSILLIIVSDAIFAVIFDILGW